MVDVRHDHSDPYLHAQGDTGLDFEVGLTGDSVAHQLRWSREAHGQDLARVAQALRIRYVYLEAIESGRYDLLPGPAYAVGFVRSYAEFLGLNSREIVSRFKREVDGIDSETELNFPTPNPQGKIPSGIVFLVCAVIAALGYGGWLYISERDATTGEILSTVPESLQSMVQADPDGAVPTNPLESPDPDALPPDPYQILADDPIIAANSKEPWEDPGVPTTTEDSAPEVVTEILADAATVLPNAARAELPAAEPQMSSPPLDDPADPAAMDVADDSPVLTAPATGLVESAAPMSGDVESGSDITLSTGETPTATDDFQAVFASIPAAPDAGLEPEKRLQPRIYGETNEGSRIVLRALQDSWVQVRDSNGALLLTRVLRVGDSYRVPDQADLTLLTGNAGGLQIEVDGVPLPPLGGIGTVRRDISLDPTQLLEQEG